MTLPADGAQAVRAVFDELCKDYPKTDAEMVEWYKQAGVRLVEYARKTGVFDVPADYKLDVVETPPPLRASIDGAAYYPAPPFKQSGVGRFYVTPTGTNDPAVLKENNRAALADLAAHEGFPGHDWHYKVMTQFRDRIAARALADARRGRRLLLDVGGLDGGRGLGALLGGADGRAAAGRARGLLHARGAALPASGQALPRPARAHRHRHPHRPDDLRRGGRPLLRGRGLPARQVLRPPRSPTPKRASCRSAERAIFRYSKWPTQAITYRLGKDQIFALRAEAAKLLGDKFSPKEFHLLFMRQGTIPAGYFREELLREIQKK